MAVVTEIPLPGIGVRYEFVTLDGDRMAVVHHRSGVRELVLFERDDPDTSHDLVRLGTEDSRTLAELLGVSQVAKELSELEQHVEGLASTGCRSRRRARSTGERSATHRRERGPGCRSWPCSAATRPTRLPAPGSPCAGATRSSSWGRPAGSRSWPSCSVRPERCTARRSCSSSAG